MRNKILTLAVLFITSLSVSAEEIIFTFPEQSQVKHITGVLYDKGTIEHIAPKQSTENPSVFTHDIPLIGEETPSFAIAYAISTSGELISSSALHLESAATVQQQLPICETELNLRESNYQQGDLFASLVELRAKRKAHIQNKIGEMLSEEFILKITTLEKSFGFQYQEPLSAEMAPIKLVHRLEALMHTIKLYETHRKR